MRKVIQITTSVSIAASGGASGCEVSTIALCDDGSMWDLEYGSRKWNRLPNVPQEGE